MCYTIISLTFIITEISDDKITAKLIVSSKEELEDYKKDGNVEIFGVNDTGLIYFETQIIERENDILTVKTTDDYSLIQRREYSRVRMDRGKITFKDIPEDIILEVKDISAGGVKIITNTSLNEDKEYDIDIKLSGNMKIECALKPIRIEENNDGNFIISGKFINLENIDRIVLVQYVFKIMMEEQSISIDNDE